MPSDDLLTQDLIEKLDDVRKFFINTLDHDAIQLFYALMEKKMDGKFINEWKSSYIYVKKIMTK